MRVAKLALILAWSAALPLFGQKASCVGEERWQVKTLADTEASKVDHTLIDKTVAEMTALPRPAKVDAALPRTSPTELTSYRIKGTLTLYKEEADQDYHLVLHDLNDDDITMIVEIPDPQCVSTQSPVLQQITKAREAFAEQFKNVGKDMHSTKIPVTVTGVGFFDIDHGGVGQTGHAPNNIEIHPVLNITFDGPVAPDFETPTATAAGARVGEAGPAYQQGGLLPSGDNRILLMWSVISLGMTIFLIYAIHQTVTTLRHSNDWSLALALKENDGKPSSSRLIAFLGLLILMVLYMEIGYVVLWRLLNNEGVPDVHAFLLTGLSLFAPYAFNQLKQFGVGMASGGAGGRSGGNTRATGATPKVLAVNPKSVSADTSTQITVSGLGFDPNARVLVTANTVPVAITSSSITPTTIQFAVTMPKNTGQYTAMVNIVNPDGGQATATFSVS